MKRLCFELDHCPDVRYFAIRQFPGYLLVNTLAEDRKVARLHVLRDELPPKVLDGLKAEYSRQQKKGLCLPASKTQPNT